MRQRLNENPTLQYPEVKNAYSFAKERHDKTGAIRRHTKEPYFVHPEAVADLVAAYGGTIDQITAALLHDTVEDTNTTSEEIEEYYGPDVAQIVEDLTNFKPEIERIGKENYISKEFLEMSDASLLVKCADCVVNYLDYPTESQKERLVRNLKFLIDEREYLPRNVKQLLKTIPELEEYLDYLNTSESDVGDYEATTEDFQIPQKFDENRRVIVTFANDEDAEEFKKETKEKFKVPVAPNKYRVVCGKSKSGGSVFVE